MDAFFTTGYNAVVSRHQCPLAVSPDREKPSTMPDGVDTSSKVACYCGYTVWRAVLSAERRRLSPSIFRPKRFLI